MNINDVSKREILDFKEFLGKVMDNNYKPLAPKNQRVVITNWDRFNKVFNKLFEN